MKKYTILLYCISFLAACQHESVMRPTDIYEKYTVPDTLPPYQDVGCQCVECRYLFDTLKYSFGDVCFNPNNPAQIAYIKSRPFFSSGFGNDIWVFDFETGKNKIIGTNAKSGLSWSAKGWLAFMATDRQIYKLKVNGDSLTQLTNRGFDCLYPEWNEKGDQIAYTTDVTGGLHLMDEYGTQIDSIAYTKTFFPPFKWVDAKTLLVSYRDSEIALIDVISKTKTVVRNVTVWGGATFFGYSPESKAFYWIGYDGLKKTDLPTRKTYLIQPEQYNTFKNIGNYCHQTDKLISVRYVIDFYKDSLVARPCWRRRYEYLTIMDTDGTNERKIVLPQ